MPPFTGFEPDPEISDPEDPYFGTGVWKYDDGTSMYGQGDAEQARALYKPPAPPTTPEPVKHEPPPMLARPDEPTAPSAEPAPPKPQERTSAINIPKVSRIAYVHNNPGNLKYVGQAGAHQGEPAEDGGHWAAFETPEDGIAALNRQVQLDAARGMTAREFVTKYAPPSSNDTDTYIQQASQALGVSPDTKLSAIDPLKVTAFVAQKESGTEIDGASLPPQTLQERGSLPSAGMPGSFNGMPPAMAEVRGTPMSPEQIQERQRGMYDQTMAQVAGVQNAAAERQRGRDEALAVVKANHDDFMANQQRQLEAASKAKLEAEQNVKSAMATQLDPGRVIKNMSTGQMVLGALSLITTTLGNAMAIRRGMKTVSATDWIEKAISDDIEQQKDDKKSRVAYWSNVFRDSDMGLKAARAEMYNAAGQFAAFQAQQKAGNADIQGQMMQDSANLIAKGQAEVQGLVDKESERVSIKYAPPKAGSGPGALGAPAQGVMPKIARVGVEDRDEETRAALADAYNPDKPSDRGQMTALTREMQEVSKLEKTLNGLQQWYGVGTDKESYDTNATGPWWNPGDWVGDDERDRQLRDLWSSVELDTRAGWKTEPNGEAVQIRLSGVNMPKRDDEAPTKLKELEAEIARRKEAIMSGTNAPVRAAWKYQNGYPLETSSGGKPVSGRIER